MEKAIVQAADWPLKDKEGEAEREVMGPGEGTWSLTPKAWTNSQAAQSPPCVVHGKNHHGSVLLLLEQGLVTSGGHL